MDDGSTTTLILALVVLIFFSAFFSASETAFSALNRVRLKVHAEDGDKRAAKAMALIDRYDDLLSSILIGNNIVNIAAASLSTVLFTRWLGGYGPTASTVVLTVVVLVFGEVTPKSLAKELPEQFAVTVAPVIQCVVWLFTPLNWLFAQWKGFLRRAFHLKNADAITEDELISIVSEAHDDGILNENESQLIRSAIEFDDMEVESILTPRVDLEMVSDTITMQELARRFEESGFSRIPVYHATVDNIIGMVLEKDFYPAYIRGVSSVEELLSSVEYTTGKAKISELLHQLQNSQNHLAVVIDEFGGTQGIVTMEDILEELVGEIWDEHDEAVDACHQQADKTWLVSGSMSMDDFCAQFSMDPDEIDAATVSGWVLSEIGHLPREGAFFEVEDLRIDIVRVTKRRILQVRVKRLPQGQLPERSESRREK